MIDRCLKFSFYWILFVSLFCSFGAHASNAWEDSPAGKCFQSTEEYLIATFGSNHKLDENIKTLEIGELKATNEKGGRKLTMIIDATPGINVTRTIFLENKNRDKVCAILDAPLSSSLDFNISLSGELPKLATSMTTSPPDFEGVKVIYKFSIKSERYFPVKCLRIEKSGKTRNVKCDQAF